MKKTPTLFDLNTFSSTIINKKQTFVSSEPNCLQCGLSQKCNSPKMSYSGEGRLRCLIIAEASGPTEDKQGTQLVGQVGQWFRKKIQERGYDLDRDFWKTNALCCFPGKVRPPTAKELRYCRPLMMKTIKELRPKSIWIMGGEALESFLMIEEGGSWFKDTGITRFRGTIIPDQTHHCFVLPTFHPSFPYRDEKNLNLQSAYDRDLDKALNFIKSPVVFPTIIPTIVPLTAFDYIIGQLESVLTQLPKFLYIDYETTGIKPYRENHKIAAISFCGNLADFAFSFPFQYRNYWSQQQLQQIKKLWVKILREEKIKKQAHGIKFEEEWSRQIMGTEVKGWDWCSMTATHILDNRRKFCKLKFQTYINFGVYPYNRKVERLLEEENEQGLNRVMDIELGDLLEYNALDSWYGSKLTFKQKMRFENRRGLQWVEKFFEQSLINFAQMQENGISVDVEYYKKSDKDMENKIKQTENELKEGEEAQQFFKVKGKMLDLGSTNDLKELMYGVLKVPPVLTEKGNYSLDKNALGSLDTSFAKKLTYLRQLEKNKNTYLAQFFREATQGVLHPSFDLHIPITYRSSSSKPNFQNLPKRNEMMAEVCRKGIIPRKGNQLLEWDYKGIEVVIAACITGDPTLIHYVSDLTTDMHRDQAMDIWILDKEEVTDVLRFHAKNDWTFPEFYGDYWKDCGENLWQHSIEKKTALGVPIIEHLRNKGIQNRDQFLQHCRELEYRFWNEKYKEYKKWKEGANEFYRKYGYVETPFGFRFTGYMTEKEVCNYPIQGTAFHCLLWTLNEVMEQEKKENWESNTIGQIHDAGLNDVVPNELDYIVDIIKMKGTEEIRQQFPFIIVPLEIKFEVSEIDGNWFEMKGYEGTERRRRWKE